MLKRIYDRITSFFRDSPTQPIRRLSSMLSERFSFTEDNPTHKFSFRKFSILSESEQKTYLDNVTDLERENINGFRPIHFIAQHSSPKIIIYLIDKGINLECETVGGWRPIHFIFRYSTFEVIKYIIEKGVNLECETSEKIKPIHILCQYSTFEAIEYAFTKCDVTTTCIIYDDGVDEYTVYDLMKMNDNLRNNPKCVEFLEKNEKKVVDNPIMRKK